MNDYERFAVDYGRLEHKHITRKQAIELLGLQRTAVTSFINNLIEKEIVERHGKGRGTYYQLKS